MRYRAWSKLHHINYLNPFSGRFCAILAEIDAGRGVHSARLKNPPEISKIVDMTKQ